MPITEVAEHSKKNNAVDVRLEKCEPSSNAQDRESQRAWDGKSLSVAIGTAAVLLTIYLLRLDNVLGLFKDDGWYVVLAKSVATGHGYNLVNLPQHSGLYFYPPMFPLLLSVLYRLSPEFPGNVFLLKSLSIFAMLLLPIFVFRLFNGRDGIPRALAYLIASSASAAPSFVMLATSSVMSECVFTVLLFATLLVTERCFGKHSAGAKLGNSAFVAVLASACYCTRTIGIAVLVAVTSYFLTRKMYKPLYTFVIVAAVCISPWIVYQHLRTLKSTQVPPIAAGYSSQFWDRYAGSPGRKVNASDLPARIWQVSTVIVGDDIGGLIVPSFYRFGSESGEEVIDMSAVIPGVSRNAMGMYGATMGLAVSGQLISLGLSVVVFVGFLASARSGLRPTELVFGLTLIILSVWPSSPMRYLIPLVPIFLFYLTIGTAKLYSLVLQYHRKLWDPWRASRILAACILAFFLYDHALYIVAKQKSVDSLQHPDWLRRFNAIEQAEGWVRDHTASEEVITSDNLPMTYLYAQRQTAMCDMDKCPQEGIRFYVNTEGVDVLIPSTVPFATAYHGIEVHDISSQHK